MTTSFINVRTITVLVALSAVNISVSSAQDSALCDLPDSDQGALVSPAGLRAIAHMCGAAPEFASGTESLSTPTPFYGAVNSNIQVNATPEVVASALATTQNEPSMASLGNVIVAGWNDSSHLVDFSFNGYGISTDGGLTWTDRGALLPVVGLTEFNVGDPWLRVHRGTGNFYYATVAVPDLNIFNTRIIVYTGASPGVAPDWPGVMDATPGRGGLQDKPAMDIDNTGGAFDGRVYVCWRQFGLDNNIKLSINDTVGPDQPLNHLGVVDLTPVSSFAETGCFVEVDQRNGDVYVAWENFSAQRSIEVRRSTDGGATFGPLRTVTTLTNIGHITTCALTGCINRQVLDADIRVSEFISSMTINERTGNLHVVFANDGAGVDESDVMHVRCSPVGADDVGYCTAPQRLNDDATQTDQWHPYIDASPTGHMSVFWYDRRNDPTNNNLIDVYRSVSNDDGITWTPNERMTDVSFGVPPLCPNIDPDVIPCYMAEYNHAISDDAFFYYMWGDNRNLINDIPDPDVFFERQPIPPRAERGSASQKGSLLVYSKIEVKWSADGSTVLQDTFVDITNDFAEDVFVQGYFVNGDMPLDELCTAQPCVGGNLLQSFEPGWNTADCRFLLTANQPHYWSAAQGSDKCQSFAVLDDDGPGRLDPETNGATRVLRGYAVFYAVEFNPDPLVGDVGAWEEIRWNHLKGDAVVVNYANATAWEYNAWAFQARAALPGERLPTPGVLQLDGIEYEAPYDTLLMDFYAAGSVALSGGGATVSVNTDLTVHPVSADLRQDGCGPVMTKVEAQIWNEFETKFSGTRRCICCWDQTMLSDWERALTVPNHFMRSALRTDKGKARLEGVGSSECDYSTICGLDAFEVLSRPLCEGPTAGVNGFGRLASQDAALLGLTTKFLSFGSGANARHDTTGLNLTGSGTQTAVIRVDVPTGPSEARNGSSDATDRAYGRTRSRK